jgi:ABC-type transport system involved in cytochrome bd biosynthesis fused ATPase/permease subunit
MNNFASTQYANMQLSLERAEAEQTQAQPQAFLTNNTLTTFLLAAFVSALMVVVSQAMESLGEDYVFATWLALWALAFASLGLLASPARRVTRSIRKHYRAYRIERRAEQQEEMLWELAHRDTRVLAEIHAAMARQAA